MTTTCDPVKIYPARDGWFVSHGTLNPDLEDVCLGSRSAAEQYAAWVVDLAAIANDRAWTDDDIAVASAEGWDLFETIGSLNGPLQIQKFDTPGDVPGCAELATDDDAWKIVADKAIAGSPVHQKALLRLAYCNPLEIWCICGHTNIDLRPHLAAWETGVASHQEESP